MIRKAHGGCAPSDYHVYQHHQRNEAEFRHAERCESITVLRRQIRKILVVKTESQSVPPSLLWKAKAASVAVM